MIKNITLDAEQEKKYEEMLRFFFNNVYSQGAFKEQASGRCTLVYQMSFGPGMESEYTIITMLMRLSHYVFAFSAPTVFLAEQRNSRFIFRHIFEDGIVVEDEIHPIDELYTIFTTESEQIATTFTALQEAEHLEHIEFLANAPAFKGNKS